MLKSGLIGSTLFFVAMSACMPPPAPAKAPEPLSLTVKVPTFAPVEAGTETQERDGVVVQMTPPVFQVERKVELSCTEQPALIVTNQQYQYEVKETPSFSVTPETTTFTVKVTNRTTQVLKLEGTVFKLIADDKEIPLESDGYKTFTSGILTPNEEKQFTIPGPPWGTLPEKANVGFSIFGMPTAFDEAGNVTKRGNFTWTFKYALESQTKDEQVAVRTETMTREDAKAKCPNLGGAGPATAAGGM